jgi:L-iditol 2-dehydrogenase
MPCHECDQCLSGRQHTCRKIRFLGCPGQAEGCLREYIILPESSCIPLPSELGPDHGAISEPLAIGVYSVKKAGKTAGLDTGILGFGPIGMSVMLALKAAGSGRIMVSEKIDGRLAIAEREGADVLINPLKDSVRERVSREAPLGLDIVFECCGQQETMDEAVKILKPGGKLVVVGIPEFENWSVNVEDTRRKEISIQFIRRQVDCVEAAIELMRSGKADTGNMVTHRFRLEEAKEAFDMVAAYRDGVMKAMIDF